LQYLLLAIHAHHSNSNALGVFGLKQRCTDGSVYDIPRECFESIQSCLLSNHSHGTLRAYTDWFVQLRFKVNTHGLHLKLHTLYIVRWKSMWQKKYVWVLTVFTVLKEYHDGHFRWDSDETLLSQVQTVLIK